VYPKRHTARQVRMIPGDHTSTIIELATRVRQAKTEDEHLHAVQAQIAFATDIYCGILEVYSSHNGLAGEALLRTLFEVAASTIILAKHRDKLKDFVRHARFTELRLMRVIEVPALKKRLAPTIAATEKEFQEVWAEFKEQRWHKMRAKDSFIEAEFQPGFYDRYYRRASAIAHGQPYVTVRNGKVGARPIAWKNMSIGAANMASLLILHLLAIVSREFKLNLDKEIGELAKEVDARAKRHMEAIRKAAGIEEGSKGSA
jgi:hypothetical protein